MEPNDQWVDDRLAKLSPADDWQPQASTALARLEGRREQRSIVRWPRMLSLAAIVAICVLTFPAPRAFAQRIIAPCVEACQNLVMMSPGDFRIERMIWGFHNWLGIAPPDFQATDASGASFRLSDYQGKVILLNFWATWCLPCKEEMPWFAEFQRTYGDKGLVVIGISMDEGGWKAVRPVMEAQKINYRVAIGDRELAQKYGGLESLPQSLLITLKGGVIVKHTGITSKIQFEREIVGALWRHLSPADRDRLRAQGFQ